MQAKDRAKTLRQSVDITRLSRIALHNLEKEGDGGMSDYTAAEAAPGGIRIESADAELDFEEQRDDGESAREGILLGAAHLFLHRVPERLWLHRGAERLLSLRST